MGAMVDIPAEGRGGGAMRSKVDVACAMLVLLLVGGALSACNDGGGGGDVVLADLYPDISVPESEDFGQLNVQTYLIKSIPISNAGQARLSLYDVYLRTGDEAEGNNYFELLDKESLPTEIQPGQTVSVRVKLLGYEHGAVTDTLVVESNDEDTPTAEVGLMGAVVKPEIKVSPQAINFNRVNIGDTETQSITIQNEGDGQLSILNVSLDPPELESEFAVVLPDTYQLRDSLPPGMGISVDVIYTPLDDVSDGGTLIIESNDVDNPRVTVDISGNGFEDEPPVVSIVAPSDGDSFYTGSAILLQAVVSDAGDDPEDLELFWSASLDGVLCPDSKASESGYAYCTAVLSTVGPQIITLVAIDSRGQTGADTVSVEIWNEETELSYVISGSDQFSIYAFTPDDNLQVWVRDGVTGELALSPCVNAMDNIMQPEPSRTCKAKYGDTLVIQGYDRYGPGFVLPELHLWYGNHDEWHQALVPEAIQWNDSMEEYTSVECHPTYTRQEWDEAHPDGPPAEDCLMVELEVQITIPPPEPTVAEE